MLLITHSSEETQELGKRLGCHAKKGMFFLLSGDLAAGKTTLTKGIGKGLGVDEIINSPTFTISKVYESGRIPFQHIDAYRLENIDYDLGLDEYADDSLTVIEWPNCYNILPNEFLDIHLRYIDDNTREIALQAHGKIYESLLEECGLC